YHKQFIYDKWFKEYADYYRGYDTLPTPGEREKVIARASKNLRDFGKLLKLMNDNKVKLLVSADDELPVPGFSLMEEMKLYKEAGISNYDILTAATYNAASFFNAHGEFGTVSKGKKANLVLLDKNPLEDIENVKTVYGTFIGGRFLKPADLLKK
ncbi:MAG TPA: amidohydrolase family protein, partial [Nitrosopumilaceae archaeon]|nr:amidohydrolase family protein [Nitrosopumilaceae archaeon]